MAFSNAWWLSRVIWSGSVQVLMRTTKHTTMEWSWWRTFACNWPSPFWLGPPSQAWPIALSNPTQHLYISEWWIQNTEPLSLLPSADTQCCTFGLRCRGEVVFAVWTQPTIKLLTAGTRHHDLGLERWGNVIQFASSWEMSGMIAKCQ